MLRDTLKTLLGAWGPSGSEHAVAEAVKNLLNNHVDSIRTDALGNLIVEKYGTDDNARRIMISAHMDHIGLVVTAIEKEGFLRVSAVGGIGMKQSEYRHVVFENGVEGVLVSQPLESGSAALKDLFIDIGAADDQEARGLVQVGDIAVYAPDFFLLGKHRIASPAMDDRCACALLVELLLYVEEQKNTIIGVFSTQEEVGIRGATVAAYAINPDLGLALDVTAWGDTPETKIPDIKLGAGPAVKIMDRSMIATPAVRDLLFDAAEAAGVAVQREVLPFGGTDGAAIQHSRGGIPAGTLSIPCRYVHSACEVIDMRDMDGALKVLLQFVDLA
ncbi:MAG: M42 family metallopeptidase [Christensenellales bacterium]